MDIKSRHLSVFELLKLSLRTANQSFGSAMAVFITVLLINVLCFSIIYGAVLVFGPIAYLLRIPVAFFSNFLNLVAMMAIIQIIAAKMEKTGISFGDAFAHSFLPALYCVISALILCIPTTLLYLGAVLSGSAWVIGLVGFLLFFLMIPFWFLTPTLALREEGPIGAILYSWHLGTTHYIRLLWTLVVLGFLTMVCGLASICIIKASFPGLIAQQNQGVITLQLMLFWLQTHWYYLIIGFIIWCYISLVTQSVITGLFLNLDYQHRPTQNREADLKVDNETPIIPTVAITPEIEVKQASVETETDEHTDIHLEQVYTASEHTPQILEQEEDRMPTILFDEDMARQLAENERKMQEQQNKSDENKDSDDTEPIKISKKPL